MTDPMSNDESLIAHGPAAATLKRRCFDDEWQHAG